MGNFRKIMFSNQKITLTVLVLMVLPTSATAQNTINNKVPNQWTLSSPNNNLSAIIDYSSDDKLSYRVELNGKMVLLNSALGVTMQGQGGDFTSNLTFINATGKIIDETYPMISGKKSIHRNCANEKTLVFRNAQDKIMHLIFRAYNDGIAYSYYFPGEVSSEIIAEVSSFHVPADSIGWLQKYKPDYQGYYPKTTARDKIDYNIGFPALFHLSTGQWVLITEAAVYGDYAGCRLVRADTSDVIFQVKLPQEKLTGKLPWSIPWRVLIVGEDLSTIVESVLVENLNPPCEIEDTSWIKPGCVAFPWMTDHSVNDNFEKLKSFVDLAHDMGWEWIEVDTGHIGSPKGLMGSDIWMTTEWLPELIEYAKGKGVDVYGWAYWKYLDTPEERSKAFTLYNKLGIKGIKADHINDDSQEAFQWRDEFIRDCAKYKLAISFHGSTLPRGQRRRWPHIMTWESILAEEWYTLPNAKNPCPPPTPTHNCTVPFTRNVVGPMDYTPVFFSNKDKKTTDAHELALSVIFESGWQCLSDSPESYNASPAKPFLKEVHAAWDDIHFIDGYPGKFTCLARRKGNDWFIAAINSEKARKIAVPLDFLKRGTYSVTLYKDSDEGKGIAVENVTLDSSQPFEISVAANGGFCMRVTNSYK